MKSVFIFMIISVTFLLAACGSNNNSDSPATPVVANSGIDLNEQRKIEPLVDYTGFWLYKQGAYENIVKIYSDIDYSTKSIATTAYGLDLNPDFGYSSLALGDKDNPEMDSHEGRVESLMEKTIAGRKQLIQINYALHNSNSLTITMSEAGKNVVQNYTRLTDESAAQDHYDQIQNARSKAVLDAEFGSDMPDYCKGKNVDVFLWLAIEHHNVSCVKSLVERNNIDVKGSGLLHAAAKQRDNDLVTYFLSRGADVNKKNSEGETPLEAVFWGGYGAIGIGEHGSVTTTANGEQVVRTLLAHGADVTGENNPVLKEVVIAINDINVVNQVLDKKPDLNSTKKDVFPQFFRDYRTRWGTGNLALLKRMLSMLTSNQVAELSQDYVVKLWALKYLDIPALQALASSGYDFNFGYAPESLADKETDSLKRILNDNSLETYQYKKYLLDEIDNISRNIQWIRNSLWSSIKIL